jgi:hypothetical protein
LRLLFGRKVAAPPLPVKRALKSVALRALHDEPRITSLASGVKSATLVAAPPAK